MTRLSALLMFLSAYLVLYLLTPFYDPCTLPAPLRLLLLVNGGVLIGSGYAFLYTFTPRTTQEDSHG